MELTLAKIESDYRENLFNFIKDKLKQESDKTISFDTDVNLCITEKVFINVDVIELEDYYSMLVEEIFLDDEGELQISGIFANHKYKTTNNYINLTSLPYNIATGDEEDEWYADFNVSSISNYDLLVIAKKL